jgi:hypothetical protein
MDIGLAAYVVSVFRLGSVLELRMRSGLSTNPLAKPRFYLFGRSEAERSTSGLRLPLGHQDDGGRVGPMDGGMGIPREVRHPTPLAIPI